MYAITEGSYPPTGDSYASDVKTICALPDRGIPARLLASLVASSGGRMTAQDRVRGARADEIGKKIADDIVLGHFEPGTRLDEVMLAKRFDVSRTPVREALKQLATQGLVVCRPNRGAVVAELTAQQIAHMFEAIGELEAACARHAAIRLSAGEREHLYALHAQARVAMRAADTDLYDRLNQEWHRVIIQGCGNPVLIEMTLGLRHRLSPFRRSQFRNLERMSASFEEHAVIIEALMAHDVSTAQRQMRSHLLSAHIATARLSSASSEPPQP